MSEPIRVVVVDDSPFVCRLLTSYLQSTSEIEVVGTALNGSRAVAVVEKVRPDVVTLDLEMPGMSGLDVLRWVMRETPTPVIIVSGVSREAAATTLRALDLGAVDFVLKYVPGADMDPEALRHEIISKVRAASRISVIRSLQPASGVAKDAVPLDAALSALTPDVEAGVAGANRALGVVVVGASTGGPTALRALLTSLPATFPSAVVIVQHMPAAFTGVLAAQLDRQVSLRVREAAAGDRLQPGTALIAPGDYHLLIGSDGRVVLNRGPLIGGHRPSIDVTMQSAAQVYGARARGVLLTGMGEDGVQGLVAIRARGGQTCVQDMESCVVNGMPRRALEMGVANHIAPPADIARILQQ